MRYYYQPTTRYYFGDNSSGGVSRAGIDFRTTMRSSPTATLASVSSGSIAAIWTGKEGFFFEFTANRPGVGVTSPFKFNSEL